MEKGQVQSVKLDDFYAVRLWNDDRNQVSGEVVMLAVNRGEQADKSLFEVPPMQDEESAIEWAVKALNAYREG